MAKSLDLDELLRRCEATGKRLEQRMERVEGALLEIRYYNRARSWLSRFVRKAEVVAVDDLGLLDPAVASGTLAPSEIDRLRDVDMIVRGRSPEGDDLLLAIEVSQTINREDVDRANEHALLLRRAGYVARPLVGGNATAEGVEEHADTLGVWLDLRRPAA